VQSLLGRPGERLVRRKQIESSMDWGVDDMIEPL
jgi:hypothetical protein